MRHATIIAAIILCAGLQAQEDANLLPNGDFSQGLNEEGPPVGWAYWTKGGEPQFELVEDEDGHFVQVTLPDRASSSRMSPPLDLPASHYYRATCQVRAFAAGDVPPRLAMRVAFPAAERAHEWLAHRDDANLWMYGGAGTYTGQEGAMAPNRWGTGFLTWRSGASGEFFWTFQRTSGDPFDDFDGKRGKDFCLTYPDPEGGAPLSTLQWEGICEGIVDHRHLVTLEQEIARAREDGRVDVANRCAAELDALRDELWAQEEPPSNRMLDEWRERIAGWIVELQQRQ